MQAEAGEVNKYQRIAETTYGILTPANVISTAGLALSIYGATHIGDLGGVLEYGGGRVLDLVDGAVARRTYSSRFGAKLDAVADKIAITAAIAGAAYEHAVPAAALGMVTVFNVVNAAATSYSEKQGAEPVTSKAGKYGMFGQNLTLGLFLLANSLGDNVALEAAGWTTAVTSTPVSTKASLAYAKQAMTISKNSRIQKSYQTRKR